MSQWESRVEEHQIFSVLDKLNSVLKEAQEREGLTQDQRESLARLKYGTTYIRNLLDRVDPALVPIKPLDNLLSNLNQVHAEVTNFLNNGNVNHLSTAHTSLDPALQLTQYIPTAKTPQDVEGLRESIVEYRRSAGQHVRYLQEEVNQLRAQVSQLQTEIEKKNQEISTDIERQKQKANEQIEAQKTEISQQKTRLDQAIQNFVQKSSEAREKHSAQITDLVTSGKEELSQLITEGKENLDTAISELEKSADRTVSRLVAAAEDEVKGLKEKQEEAAEIVGIIARTGMAGGYQQEADEERSQANFWRWIAVIAMAAIVGMAGWMVLTVAQDTADTIALLTKAFASLTLGILAGYAGREAGKHRRREQRNRRLQLELSSIDSYLESLPESERNAIKGALADRLFGNPDPPEDNDGEGVRPASMMDLVKLLMPVSSQ